MTLLSTMVNSILPRLKTLITSLLSIWNKANKKSKQPLPFSRTSETSMTNFVFEKLSLLHSGLSGSSFQPREGQIAKVLLGNIKDPTDNWIIKISIQGQDHVIQGDSHNSQDQNLVEAIFTALLYLQNFHFKHLIFITDGLSSQLWNRLAGSIFFLKIGRHFCRDSIETLLSGFTQPNWVVFGIFMK